MRYTSRWHLHFPNECPNLHTSSGVSRFRRSVARTDFRTPPFHLTDVVAYSNRNLGLNTRSSLITTELKLSVGVTGHAYLLEIEGLFTQGSRPGRTFGDSVGGSSKWTVLIGRTGFDTIPSIPEPTLSLSSPCDV